jgi:hypothetical protein
MTDDDRAGGGWAGARAMIAPIRTGSDCEAGEHPRKD